MDSFIGISKAEKFIQKIILNDIEYFQKLKDSHSKFYNKITLEDFKPLVTCIEYNRLEIFKILKNLGFKTIYFSNQFNYLSVSSVCKKWNKPEFYREVIDLKNINDELYGAIAYNYPEEIINVILENNPDIYYKELYDCLSLSIINNRQIFYKLVDMYDQNKFNNENYLELCFKHSNHEFAKKLCESIEDLEGHLQTFKGPMLERDREFVENYLPLSK